MKKGTKLLILVAVLVVAVGGYILVRAFTAQPETVPEEDAPLTVLQLDAASITGFRWAFSDVDLSLEKQDDAWVYADDPVFPLAQSFPQAMVNTVSSLQAVEHLAQPGDWAEYGLDDPAITVTVTTTGGAHTLTMGGYNSFSNAYYLQLDDDTTQLWLVEESVLTAFFYTLNDLIEVESLPSISNIRQVTLATAQAGADEDGSEPPAEDGRTLLLTRPEDPAAMGLGDDAIWFTEADGDTLALDTDRVMTLYGLITGLQWQRCVNYKATEADLAGYGLDAPLLTATLDYETRTTQETGETDADGSAITEEVVTPQRFTLLVGNAVDETYYYAMLPGSSMVYVISAETVDSLLAASAETLLPEADG